MSGWQWIPASPASDAVQDAKGNQGIQLVVAVEGKNGDMHGLVSIVRSDGDMPAYAESAAQSVNCHAWHKPMAKHDSRRQTKLIKQAVTIWPVCPYCRLPRYQPRNDVMA
jgi:hypothetical protein